MTEQDLLANLRGGGWWRIEGDMVGLIGNFNSLYLIEEEIGSFAPVLTLLDDTFAGLTWEIPGTKANIWSVAQWGTWRIVTNGTTGLYRWNSVEGLQTIFASAAPRVLLTHGAHVLACNFTNAPNRFAWCSADDVDDWTPTPANSAGDLDIREFASEIIAAVPLGDSVAMYSDNSLAIVNYLGAPLYYGYDVTISEGVGAYSMNSVFSVGNLNYGVGRNGFFKTDGVSYELLGQGEIWDTFKAELNRDQTSLIHGYHLESEQELWWWYPVGSGQTNPSKAIVYNYIQDIWTFVDCERSGSLPPTDIEYPLAFRPDGYIFFHEKDYVEARADFTDGPIEEFPIPCWIESKAFTLSQTSADGSVFNAEHRYKFIQAVLMSVIRYEDMGLLVRVGTMEDLKSQIVYWSEPFPDDLVWPMLSGRYIKLRIESNTSKRGWEVQGIDIHGTITGNYR
jgi:hypothetical protein